MTSSLREKRRYETAREIQRATLELTVQSDLENITTEEIAAAAGVSTRTFFNYYANKEAAAIGLPPHFSEENKDALRIGTAPLAHDLKAFLSTHMDVLVGDVAVLRMIGKILRSNEKARNILDGFLAGEREALTTVLCARVGNPQTAAVLAKTATDLIGAAIHLWEHEEDLSLDEALGVVWEGLMDASRLLVSPN